MVSHRVATGQEMVREKILQGQKSQVILFWVRENWHFEEKSGKIEIIQYGKEVEWYRCNTKGILFWVRENWHFEEKSGKIEIIQYGKKVEWYRCNTKCSYLSLLEITIGNQWGETEGSFFLSR